MTPVGVLAHFSSASELFDAVKDANKRGAIDLDAFSPHPIEEIDEILGSTRTTLRRVAFWTLVGGISGCLTGYLMQYYASAFDYPIHVGGRPLHSWPAFVPVTFELTILFAALATAIGMLVINGLPRPYHPVFSAPFFNLARPDGYYLFILPLEGDDVSGTKTIAYLLGLGAHDVCMLHETKLQVQEASS